MRDQNKPQTDASAQLTEPPSAAQTASNSKADKNHWADDPQLSPSIQFAPQRPHLDIQIDDALASECPSDMREALPGLERMQSPYLAWAGKGEGWEKLKRDIRTELDESLVRVFQGTVSLPFAAGDNHNLAFKVVDDRGIESLKVTHLEG